MSSYSVIVGGTENQPQHQAAYDDIRLAAEPYFNKLAAFETAGEIRTFLAAENVKADQKSPTSCPIATYVGQDRPGRLMVFRRSVCAHVAPTVVEHGWSTTPAMRMFIANFDEGIYPELIAGESE